MSNQTKVTQSVPLLDLKAQYATIRDEINDAIQRVVESQYFILGPEVAALEEEIAAYSHCKFGVGVSSGTDALLLALMVIDLKPGDEVIVPSYTFFATAGAVVRLGATPVFVDIDPRTYNIDPNQIEAKINSRTRAIIPVHLYGQVAEMSPIMDIAQKHNLTVIEDAAQAIGSEYQEQRAGAIGHMSCFSFFPSKNLGAFGDAGMMTTNDPEIADRLKLFRNHGYKPKYYNAVVGGNFRLDSIQATVLRVKLKYLDKWTASRQENATTYRRLFDEAGLAIGLEDFNGNQNGVVLPHEEIERRHIYNQFVIRCNSRDELMAHLKANQIGCEIYYPQPLHLQECFDDLGYQMGDLPQSEAAARQTLALPIYPELTEVMQTRVVETITQFYEEHTSA
jgi:dTDP-4-amino-4,6-dideoxygalactose transaminase